MELFISLKDQEFQPFKFPIHLSTKSKTGNLNGLWFLRIFSENQTESRGKLTAKTIKK